MCEEANNRIERTYDVAKNYSKISHQQQIIYRLLLHNFRK